MRSKKERLNELAKTAGSELKNHSNGHYLLFGTTITGLVFEWSPANEALLGMVGVATHNAVGSDDSMFLTVVDRLTTGLATGAVSFTEQAIVGGLTAVSLSKFPKTFDLWQKTRSRHAVDNISSGSSVITALGLGSSMAILEKKLIEKDTTLKSDLGLVAKISAIVGLANVALGSVVSGGLDVLDKNGQQELSGNIEALVKNPLTYIAIFGLAKTVSILRDKKNNNKST